MAEMRKDIDTLFRQNEEFRKEVEELSVKVAELYVLKRMMAVSATEPMLLCSAQP